MSEKSSLSVRTHAGTRYGGAAQKSEQAQDVYKDDEVPPRRNTRPTTRTYERREIVAKKKSPPVDVGRIQWVSWPAERQFFLDHSEAWIRLKRRIYRNQAIHPELYQHLLDYMAVRKEGEEAKSLLSLVATGTIPDGGGKKKYGDFVKVAIHVSASELLELVLPAAFFTHCKKALKATLPGPFP